MLLTLRSIIAVCLCQIKNWTLSPSFPALPPPLFVPSAPRFLFFTPKKRHYFSFTFLPRFLPSDKLPEGQPSLSVSQGVSSLHRIGGSIYTQNKKEQKDTKLTPPPRFQTSNKKTPPQFNSYANHPSYGRRRPPFSPRLVRRSGPRPRALQDIPLDHPPRRPSPRAKPRKDAAATSSVRLCQDRARCSKRTAELQSSMLEVAGECYIKSLSQHHTDSIYQTFLRIAGVEVDIVPSTNHASPSGALPFLLPPTIAQSSARPAIPLTGSKIERYTKDHSSHEIPADSSSRIEAYEALLSQSLRPAWVRH